jgi:hypothetical protein
VDFTSQRWHLLEGADAEKRLVCWVTGEDAWFAGFWVAMLSFLGRKAGLVDVKVHPKALEPPRPLHLMERATGACAKGIC